MICKVAVITLITFVYITNVHCRTWIWVGGSNSSSYVNHIFRLTDTNFSSTVQPGSSNHCLLYSNKRHQLILYGTTGLYIYDITRRQWACVWPGLNNGSPGQVHGSKFPDNFGEYTSTGGPSNRNGQACTLHPDEETLWVFGGKSRENNSPNGTPVNQIWSFNLVDYNWARWYGTSTTTVTNYTTSVLGTRQNANILFTAPDTLTIMNGFDETPSESSNFTYFHDVWQFNVTSQTMSLTKTWQTFNGIGNMDQALFFPARKDYTVFANSGNEYVYQVFTAVNASQGNSNIARIDTSGQNAWLYAPLRGNLSTIGPIYPSPNKYDIYAPDNLPRVRPNTILFFNPSADSLAIYSGAGQQRCNDFWIFNITLAQWALAWGDPDCRTASVNPIYPNNTAQINETANPGVRYFTNGVLDRNGAYWMYGGKKTSSSEDITYADLWVFTETNCTAGSYFNWTEYVCRPCPVDTFTSTYNSDAQCTPCPSGTSTNGQVGGTSCHCQERYFNGTGCQKVSVTATQTGNGASATTYSEFQIRETASVSPSISPRPNNIPENSGKVGTVVYAIIAVSSVAVIGATVTSLIMMKRRKRKNAQLKEPFAQPESMLSRFPHTNLFPRQVPASSSYSPMMQFPFSTRMPTSATGLPPQKSSQMSPQEYMSSYRSGGLALSGGLDIDMLLSPTLVNSTVFPSLHTAMAVGSTQTNILPTRTRMTTTEGATTVWSPGSGATAHFTQVGGVTKLLAAPNTQMTMTFVDGQKNGDRK